MPKSMFIKKGKGYHIATSDGMCVFHAWTQMLAISRKWVI